VVAVEDRVAGDFARLVPLVPPALGRVEGFALGAGRAVGLTLYAAGPRP
jgi:hypothetical protein